MIQIIIAGLLAYGIIKLIEKVQRRDDHVSAAGIVAFTVFLAFLVNVLIKQMGFPDWYSAVFLPLYFIVPLLILRQMWRLSWGRSSAYAGIILSSILTAEIVLILIALILAG